MDEVSDEVEVPGERDSKIVSLPPSEEKGHILKDDNVADDVTKEQRGDDLDLDGEESEESEDDVIHDLPPIEQAGEVSYGVDSTEISVPLKAGEHSIEKKEENREGLREFSEGDVNSEKDSLLKKKKRKKEENEEPKKHEELGWILFLSLWVLFALQGIAAMLPFNVYVSAPDYFEEFFGSNIMTIISFTFLLPNCIGSFILTMFGKKLMGVTGIIMTYGIPYLWFVFSLGIFPFFKMMGVMENKILGYVMTLGFIAISGAMQSSLQTVGFSWAYFVDERFSVAVSSGYGLCGVLVAIVRYITKLSMIGESSKKSTQERANYISAFVYFELAAISMLILFFLLALEMYLIYLAKKDEIQENSRKNKKKKKKKKKIKQTPLIIRIKDELILYLRSLSMMWYNGIFIFFVFTASLSVFPGIVVAIPVSFPHSEWKSWFGVVIVSFFMFGDCIGRMSPILLKNCLCLCPILEFRWVKKKKKRRRRRRRNTDDDDLIKKNINEDSIVINEHLYNEDDYEDSDDYHRGSLNTPKGSFIDSYVDDDDDNNNEEKEEKVLEKSSCLWCFCLNWLIFKGWLVLYRFSFVCFYIIFYVSGYYVPGFDFCGLLLMIVLAITNGFLTSTILEDAAMGNLYRSQKALEKGKDCFGKVKGEVGDYMARGGQLITFFMLSGIFMGSALEIVIFYLFGLFQQENWG